MTTWDSVSSIRSSYRLKDVLSCRFGYLFSLYRVVGFCIDSKSYVFVYQQFFSSLYGTISFFEILSSDLRAASWYTSTTKSTFGSLNFCFAYKLFNGYRNARVCGWLRTFILSTREK